MTAINTDIGPLIRSGSHRPAAGNQLKSTASGTAFQDLLADTLDPRSAHTRPVEAGTGLPELVSPMAIIPEINQETASITHAETMLDLLETYASRLGDPSWNIKDLPDMLKTIGSRVDSLSAELKDNPDQPEGLTSILDQILAMVRIEQIKLARGDYADRQ